MITGFLPRNQAVLGLLLMAYLLPLSEAAFPHVGHFGWCIFISVLVAGAGTWLGTFAAFLSTADAAML